ncbi:MAG: efflux RND transporter periplasmic adaptor subunit [Acidobacteria bacterium]|nr:efflux RND transporter periplasmic adaptor subunit [Acidobacteriota bacterium]
MEASRPSESPRSAPELASLKIRRDAPQARRPFLWLLVGSVGAVGVALAAYLAISSYLSTVQVEKTVASLVTQGEALMVLSVAGYVEAETRADISPKITSRVTSLNVTEGSRVKKGEILARLDHTDLDAQLNEAQAAWGNAKSDLQRKQTLYEQGLSTRADLDAAVALESSSRARVNYVKALLDYTILRAPFDGVVVAKRAHVGEAVSPFGSPGQGSSNGGAIVTLVDFSTLYVGADVNESNLSHLKPDQPAEITLDAYPDHVYHGAMRQIIPSADRQKGTVKVKVGIADPDEKILPDLSARVNFTAEPTQGRDAKTSVQVPQSALTTLSGRSGVFLIQGEKAVFRPVTPGRSSEGMVEIQQGLVGGETLVAGASGLSLSDGQKIRIKQ